MQASVRMMSIRPESRKVVSPWAMIMDVGHDSRATPGSILIGTQVLQDANRMSLRHISALEVF